MRGDGGTLFVRFFVGDGLPGGRVITSGIVRERADEVRQSLECVGLETVGRHDDGSWVALTSERRR